MVNVAAYVEGPTEWFVARKLWKRRILNGMDFLDKDRFKEMFIGGGIDLFLKKLLDPDSNGKKGILLNPPSNKILLMFDQEQISNLEDAVKSKMETYFQKFGISSDFRQHDDFSNVFIGEVHMENASLSVAVHVADKEGACKNKDFEGTLQ